MKNFWIQLKSAWSSMYLKESESFHFLTKRREQELAILVEQGDTEG